MVWKGRIVESLRLFHIDKFRQIPMKESIRNVQLTNMPFLADYKCEEKPDCRHLNDRTKGVMVVNTPSW